MTDEKPLFDSRHPDFTAMPFEELMTTQIKPNDGKFNQPLWQEQCERLKKFNLVSLAEFKGVDEYQDEIAARLTKLEDKFTRLLKLLDNKTGIHSHDSPLTITIQNYVEGKIE